MEHNLDGEEFCLSCALGLVAFTYSVQKKLSAAQVLCFPGTEVIGAMNLICVFISACLAERRGLGLWSLRTAQPNTSCQLKFRESKKRFSTKKLFTFWGCPFAGGNQGGSVFRKPEEWRGWKAESIYPYSLLCETDLFGLISLWGGFERCWSGNPYSKDSLWKKKFVVY